MLDPKSTQVSTDGLSVAILVSQYHGNVTNALAEGAKSAFIDAGGNEEQLTTIPVSGAWELPVVAASVLKRGDFDAIIAIGCIIAGETTHDQVIAHAIARGLMQLSIDWGKPVSMGVLSCHSLEQAQARAGGDCGNKGIEAMNAALSTVTTLSE
ncbi:MAG: 6,7-dimethyl-8-ribityllumazine synthase [Phycisphaerales bacterium]|jgi:6,7-dimethyl-8-ribityllumazine synthase|nr:6,7-dimethyl-8-ribityllumazine synthase [Phycisphaerales bacterium]MDP6693695.1 6,7-dimethyl-8-ribityllumazine synthase [Phycisphaerales bacterium]